MISKKVVALVAVAQHAAWQIRRSCLPAEKPLKFGTSYVQAQSPGFLFSRSVRAGVGARKSFMPRRKFGMDIEMEDDTASSTIANSSAGENTIFCFAKP